jgi:hypothetical protein
MILFTDAAPPYWFSSFGVSLPYDASNQNSIAGSENFVWEAA